GRLPRPPIIRCMNRSIAADGEHHRTRPDGVDGPPDNSLASCGITTGLTWSRPIFGLYRGRVPIVPPDQREDAVPQPGSGRDNKPTCRLYRSHGCLVASPTGGKNWWFHRTILI